MCNLFIINLFYFFKMSIKGDKTLSLPALKVGKSSRNDRDSTAVTFSDHINSVRNKRVTYEDFETNDTSSVDRIKTSMRKTDDAPPVSFA